MAGIARAWIAVALAVAAGVGGTDARARSLPDATRLALEQAESVRAEASARSERLFDLATSRRIELEALHDAASALDARRVQAALRLRTDRSALAAILAASGTAPTEVRRRLVIAELARATAEGAAELAGLGRIRGALGGRLRAATTACARAAAQAALAEAMLAAAGVRWRSALRARIAAILPEPAQAATGVAAMALMAAGPEEIARRPALATARETGIGRKRGLAGELRLDPRLLRAAVPATRPKRRAPASRERPIESLLPIAGVRDVPTGPSPRRAQELELTTRVSQPVSAPVAGKVVYARRFRDLGPLLIIDRGGGYHVVLVGMTRLDVREGARLVAGQSVGRIEARSDEPASLHMQLRHEGVPLDPAAWPRAYQDKVAS